MLSLHPTGSAFWMPIASAMAAGLIGGLIGYAAGSVAGVAIPELSGLFVGAISAGFVWIVDHFYWLAILAETYRPVTYAPVEEEKEDETGRLIVRSADGNEIRYIDPPVNDFLMFRFAQGILNGKAPTYPNWVGEDNPFNAAQFQALRSWLVGRGYARNVVNGMIEITEEGQRLLALIISGKIFPTESTRISGESKKRNRHFRGAGERLRNDEW